LASLASLALKILLSCFSEFPTFLLGFCFDPAADITAADIMTALAAVCVAFRFAIRLSASAANRGPGVVQ